jgi:hypothetical protein
VNQARKVRRARKVRWGRRVQLAMQVLTAYLEQLGLPALVVLAVLLACKACQG